MAAAAFGAELATMNVLATMTRDARTRLANALANALRVARFALQPGVSARQIKVGLCIVIEHPARPVDGGMARGAISS